MVTQCGANFSLGELPWPCTKGTLLWGSSTLFSYTTTDPCNWREPYAIWPQDSTGSPSMSQATSAIIVKPLVVTSILGRYVVRLGTALRHTRNWRLGEREGPNELMPPNSLAVFLCHPREQLTYPCVNVLTDEVYRSLKSALSQIPCPFSHSCIIPQHVHCFCSYCDNMQDWARLYSSDRNLVNQSVALYCCENLLECCFTTFPKFKSMDLFQMTAFAPRYTTTFRGQIPVLTLLLDYYYYYYYYYYYHHYPWWWSSSWIMSVKPMSTAWYLFRFSCYFKFP